MSATPNAADPSAPSDPSAPIDGVLIDVVRTDVLLWVLGGFASSVGGSKPSINELVPSRSDGRAANGPLPAAYVRGLKALAAKPRCAYGEIAALARRFNRSVDSARMLVYYRRRAASRSARYWDDVA